MSCLLPCSSARSPLVVGLLQAEAPQLVAADAMAARRFAVRVWALTGWLVCRCALDVLLVAGERGELGELRPSVGLAGSAWGSSRASTIGPAM